MTISNIFPYISDNIFFQTLGNLLHETIVAILFQGNHPFILRNMLFHEHRDQHTFPCCPNKAIFNAKYLVQFLLYGIVRCVDHMITCGN